MSPSVSVTIVTYNSEKYLEACLRSVFSQTYTALKVVVVDNASTDGSREILRRFAGRIRLILNDKNLGFAEGQNQAIAASTSEWVLVLNPDVVLSRGFVG